MKAIGILMVVLFFLFTGLYFSEKTLSVLRGMQRTDKLIENIILGLKSEKMTIAEIFENAVLSCDEHTKTFIENISLKNLSCAAESAKKCGFCSNETAVSILNEVFFVLGKYSAEEQLSEIGFCRSKLKNLFEKNEETLKEKARLFRYSGLFAGMAAAIILI